ncbi:MAG TPA: hypothetical protein VF221_05080 [Chloroflexota bacterium]
MTDEDLIEFVERLAPQVDRLVIAGHRAAAPHARDLRESYHIQSVGLLIDLRKLILGHDGLQPQAALTFERYLDPVNVAATLDAHVEEGMLVRVGSRYRPTDRGREVLLALTDAQARGTDELWRAARDLAEADRLAGDAVFEGSRNLDSDRYPAFSLDRAGYEPPEMSHSFSLWTHLTSLRYARADAHALAWQEADLDALGVRLLTDICHKKGPTSVTTFADALACSDPSALEARLQDMQHRGWMTREPDGWEVTERGRAARVTIERATNVRNTTPYRGLEIEQRSRLLETLTGLRDSAP